MRFIIQRKAIGRVSLYIRNISHFFQFIHGMMSAECLFSSISLERAVATHSSTLAWKIPWMEKPGRLQSMGSLRVRHNWATSLSPSLSCIGEGNGNPLQCSCLENPGDRGAWWAAVYGVTQSWTWLKRLSSSSSSSISLAAINIIIIPSLNDIDPLIHQFIHYLLYFKTDGISVHFIQLL